MATDFHNVSYDLHQKHYANLKDHNPLEWQNEDSVDYWRHFRMYNCLDPVIESYPGAQWMTVGDGRFGCDAHYILSKGEKQVLATDISDTYLSLAKQHGYIKEYSVENAERLSFEDNSFDFILCKESYHHFPRPMVALYEMLRVARKGVILIEPQDHQIATPDSFFRILKQKSKGIIKHLLNKPLYYDFGRYEVVGNYVFTISEREIEKVALGLNYDMVAFKGINDYYLEGVEREPASPASPIFQKVRQEIEKKDANVRKGLIPADLLIAIIFKTNPNNSCISSMESAGYNVKQLPKNPYIS